MSFMVGKIRLSARIIAGLSTLIVVTLAFDAGQSAAASATKVVELFTSQGCSSCPPADKLLGDLAERPDVIALAYHVDYWDYLGWKDRFGLAQSTARQRNYARSLALQGVYTPQMVVNGVTDLVGSDRPAIIAALDRQRPQVAVPVQLICRDGELQVEIGANDSHHIADITLVAFEKAAETRVERGENAGRRLTEYGVVRAIKPVGQWRGAAQKLSIDLASLPEDASMAAILVQEDGLGPIVGAAAIAIR